MMPFSKTFFNVCGFEEELNNMLSFVSKRFNISDDELHHAIRDYRNGETQDEEESKITITLSGNRYKISSNKKFHNSPIGEILKKQSISFEEYNHFKTMLSSLNIQFEDVQVKTVPQTHININDIVEQEEKMEKEIEKYSTVTPLDDVLNKEESVVQKTVNKVKKDMNSHIRQNTQTKTKLKLVKLKDGTAWDKVTKFVFSLKPTTKVIGKKETKTSTSLIALSNEDKLFINQKGWKC